ncbi:hypothetical protein NW762_003635 [Fusarium torreyae]|uniref:C2H2-type domain-containing protein n=1 Tax=Fusarium torreyae TaxID=1237075 RepID=A0A9W8VHV7_9HYPO|nr:hypothetical protein NW762_003635 [Fusarium torreyae]
MASHEYPQSDAANNLPQGGRQQPNTGHNETPVGTKEASGSGSHNGRNGGGGTAHVAAGPQPEQFLACIMFQLNPERNRDCEHLRLKTWPRALQHLSRAHVLNKNHCPQCRHKFRTEEQKNHHVRRGGCQIANVEQSRCLLQTDYDNLKNLHGSDEERWEEAWRRLFPHLPTPSPAPESRIESIRRTGPWLCVPFLRRAIDGDTDLLALGTELINELTRPPTVATRGGDVAIASIQTSQAAGLGPVTNVAAHQPGTLPMPAWTMAPPAATPMLPQPHYPSPILSFKAEPQSGLPARETFSPEAIHLFPQSPYSMFTHFPPGPSGFYDTIPGPEPSLASANLQQSSPIGASLQETPASFTMDQDILSGELISGYGGEDELFQCVEDDVRLNSAFGGLG